VPLVRLTGWNTGAAYPTVSRKTVPAPPAPPPRRFGVNIPLPLAAALDLRAREVVQ